MLLSILMSTALSTYVTPTDWLFNQGTDEFTATKITTLVGQNHNNAFFSLDCAGKNLVLSVNYPNHRGNIQKSAWAKTDNNPGIRLTGRVYPTGFTLSRRLDDSQEFKTLIEQLAKAKSMKWRLFQQDMTPIEVSFDLQGAGSGVSEVLTACYL